MFLNRQQGNQLEGIGPLVKLNFVRLIGAVVQPVAIFRDAITAHGCLDEELRLYLRLNTFAICQHVDDTVQAVAQMGNVEVAMECPFVHSSRFRVELITVNGVDTFHVGHFLVGRRAKEVGIVS